MQVLKRIAAIVSSLVLLQSAAVTSAAVNAADAEPVMIYEENGYYLGDVSDNSQLDVLDVVMLQSFLLGRKTNGESHLNRADMNHDGVLDVFDLALLKRAVLGMMDSEWIEKPEEITYEPVTIDVLGAESADITLSGVPGAAIRGYIGHSDGMNEIWMITGFEGVLDADGNYSFRFDIPEDVGYITVIIEWSGEVGAAVAKNAKVADVTLNYPQTVEPELPEEGTLIESTVKFFGKATPSVGNAKMLSIYVDFADKTYGSQMYSDEQIENELFGAGTTHYPFESVSSWYERSSYGNLHIDGDVYRYTCSGNMEDYMNPDRVFEDFAMEVLTGLDSQINYADYDENHDGVIDCLMFTVPLDGADQATLDFWYGCTATWYENPWYSVDGMKVSQYIIMDVMPYAENMIYLKQTVIHEMGHSLGLPDYYLYYSGSDWEGLKGDAGYERMDDSIGDFCSFSKLMYGWLKDTEVQTYEGSGAQTFLLDDASNTGSCLILPISSTAGDYCSEYFLVEYVSKTGNNSDVYTNDSGVRVFHIQAEIMTDYWGNTYFKHESYSEQYTGDDKIRIIRLVNEENGFYHAGDAVTFGTSNFAGYDANGNQTIDTGYTISIGDIVDGKYSITVDKN